MKRLITFLKHGRSIMTLLLLFAAISGIWANNYLYLWGNGQTGNFNDMGVGNTCTIKNLKANTTYGVLISNKNTFTGATKWGATSDNKNSPMTVPCQVPLSGQKDFYFKTSVAGDYTFTATWSGNNPTLSIVAPAVTNWGELSLCSNLNGNWSNSSHDLLTKTEADDKVVYTKSITVSDIKYESGNTNQFRFRLYSNGKSTLVYPSSNTEIPLNGSVSQTTTGSSTDNYWYVTTTGVNTITITATYDRLENKWTISSNGDGIDIPVSGIDPNAYYLVSPELTGGKLLPNFKMIASRNRNGEYGDGKTSTKFFTINFKDDEIRTMTSASSFHWYISKGDKTVTYRPYHTQNNNYQLGIAASDKKGKNGNVQYETYENSKTGNTKTNVFEMPVGKGVSYTIFLNTDNAVTMNINKKSLSTDGNGTKDPNGYYLIGNFSSAKGDVHINPNQESGRKKMTLYRYKNGFRYEESDPSVTDVTADSLVYMVHVEKPVDGWGELYMDVAPGTLITNNNFNSNWEGAWSQIIRPQVSADKADQVDARALKGGLQEAAGGEMSLNPEVDGDLYDSYDFSMNLTTSTYRLVFNTKLYIVGDAVSTLDGKTGNGFDLTKDKIQLTYDREEGCYKYEGDGGMLHFDNGEQFRFVVNGNSYKLNYSENVNEPYEIDGEGKYAKKTVNGETQYRNMVSYHGNGNTSTTDPNASLDGNHNVTFALGTGNYVLRFYLPQDNEPYYTINESANLVLNPDDKTYAWGDEVTPTGRVIYSNNETWGERGFIFTVDGSTPQLLDDGQLPTNTKSAMGTNIVRYNHDHFGAFGTIAAAIKGTADKKITFNDVEISQAISTSGNVIVKAYPVVVDPDAGNGKYKVDGDMQSVVYKFRNEVVIEITPMAGKFIRTFSHGSNIELPEDESVKAYEVYRYEQPTEADKENKKHGKVYLRRLTYIPADMGVVLVGETEEETFVKPLLVRTENLAEKNEDLWYKKSSYTSDEWNNYLEPAVTGVPNLGNTLEDSNGNILARYFGLGHFFNTSEYKNHPEDYTGADDYIGFFRLTSKGRCGANKAYLSIPAVVDERSQKYGYIDFNGQWLDDIYDDPGDGYQSYSKAALIFDDIDDTPTGITTVETDGNEANDNTYYTLQGIKVSKPVQGVYIHNGKKVIIK